MLSTTIFFLEIWEGGRTLSQAIGKVPIMLIQFSTHSHHCINYRFCIHKIVSLLGYRIWQNLVYHLILASFYVNSLTIVVVFIFIGPPQFLKMGSDRSFLATGCSITGKNIPYVLMSVIWVCFYPYFYIYCKKIVCTDKSTFPLKYAKKYMIFDSNMFLKFKYMNCRACELHKHIVFVVIICIVI